MDCSRRGLCCLSIDWRKVRIVTIIALFAAVVSCGSSNTESHCQVRWINGKALPDPVCTPGATNANVTQDNIASTICKPGWTASVRPTLDRKPFERAYGLTAGELDHLVPLELGGAPSDPKNLWIQPGSIPNTKDAVENTLKRRVCQKLETLKQAQNDIATNWTTALG